MDGSTNYGPWNPGIQSRIPGEVLPQLTIVRPENVFQSLTEIDELCDFTGLAREEIAAFRPQRLAVHELLIRISADYSVSDGDEYEDLGVNFRLMARRLLENHLQPHMRKIDDFYDRMSRQVLEKVEQELETALYARPTATAAPKGWWQRLRKRKGEAPPPVPPEIREAQALAKWQQKSLEDAEDSSHQSIYRCLSRVCGAVMARHGRIRGDKEMLATLVTRQVCNTYGSVRIGALIDPMIAAGAAREGYAPLPHQTHPVIMNVKGSSASGKSTLRPLQHQLARRLGLRWGDFALISPDIWRKFLLDYESLGAAYKYAATCSGHELKIVDQKLDAYMADKAQRKAVPHLLIDRFRFDSFAEKAGGEGSNLLTRFGAKVFMFYMITPPEATVERAWERGLKVGRYKAVDDLLHHNVEAFTGMPGLFFTWALDREKDVHYEFLDNSVQKGQRPRTVAFGENGSLVILDIGRIMDIDRYQKINIDADSAADVYPQGDAMAPEHNRAFLRECVARLTRVDFANAASGEIAARTMKGKLVEWQPDALEAAVPDAETRAALLHLFPSERKHRVDCVSAPVSIATEKQQTLGEWGS